jgi:hypothetical protein
VFGSFTIKIYKKQMSQVYNLPLLRYIEAGALLESKNSKNFSKILW